MSANNYGLQLIPIHHQPQVKNNLFCSFVGVKHLHMRRDAQKGSTIKAKKTVVAKKSFEFHEFKSEDSWQS